jgi:Phage tail sheath protein subtilisin-like domain/Phage tail sheath C-terminal domain
MVNMLASPGVTVNEQDSTTSIVTGNPTLAGFAGIFNKGPMEEIVPVTNIADLEKIFGKPDATNKVDYHLAKTYLQISNGLQVVRITTSSSKTATSIVPNDPSQSPVIKNEQDYLNSYYNGQGSAYGTFAAKTPGAWGNSLKVSICPADSSAFNTWEYKSIFPTAPATSSYVSSKGGTLDELHIVIVDVNGSVSGVAGKILKTFAYVSQASDAQTLDGANNYYKTILNSDNEFVYWLSHPTALTDAGKVATNQTFTVTQTPITVTLSGGVTDSTATITEITNAYEILFAQELLPINIMIGPRLPASIGEGGFNISDATTLANNLITKANAKKKPFLCLSPPIELTVNRANPLADLATFATSLNGSSYAGCDTTACRVIDDTDNGSSFIFIPGSANFAGTLAYTDRNANIATSPAGSQRGQYQGISRLSYNPSQADRDVLFKARLNPVITKTGRGTYLFGDKTLLTRSSAFDQIGVRRVFTYLQQIISEYAENLLFEPNDLQSRESFKGVVEPFLKQVQSGRLIIDSVVETPISSDPDEFIGNIKILPANSIRYITLNFIATRTGFTFNEVVG